MFILRSTFQKPFESYDRIASSCISVESKIPIVESAIPTVELAIPSVEGIVKRIADKETKSSLYDLGEMIVEKQMLTYKIAGANVQFRVNELYGAKLLHARTEPSDEWSFITKFDCN